MSAKDGKDVDRLQADDIVSLFIFVLGDMCSGFDTLMVNHSGMVNNAKVVESKLRIGDGISTACDGIHRSRTPKSIEWGHGEIILGLDDVYSQFTVSELGDAEHPCSGPVEVILLYQGIRSGDYMLFDILVAITGAVYVEVGSHPQSII